MNENSVFWFLLIAAMLVVFLPRRAFWILLFTAIILISVAGCMETTEAARTEVFPDPCGLEAVQCDYETAAPIGDVSVGPVRVCKLHEVVATAYNYVRAQTDASPCRAANGEDVCLLHDAGDLSCAASFPFGTRIVVPGFGSCTVRDRLAPSQRKRWRVDLGFGGQNTRDQAIRWGRRRVTAAVCQPAGPT